MRTLFARLLVHWEAARSKRYNVQYTHICVSASYMCLLILRLFQSLLAMEFKQGAPPLPPNMTGCGLARYGVLILVMRALSII